MCGMEINVPESRDKFRNANKFALLTLLSEKWHTVSRTFYVWKITARDIV